MSHRLFSTSSLSELAKAPHTQKIPSQILEKDAVFVARIDNAKMISSLLKAIQFKNLCTCECTAEGMKFSVEDRRSVQAHLYFEKGLFSEYKLHEPSVVYNIGLDTLVECLNVFSSPMVALKIVYGGVGKDLLLLLEESGVVTVCRLKTFDVAEESIDFLFRQQDVVSKIILESEALLDAFSEILPHTDKVSMVVQPATAASGSIIASKLQISGASTISGSISVDISSSSPSIESFSCDHRQSFIYKFTALLQSFKALSQSTKTSLRINERGFLSLQYMIPIENSDNSSFPKLSFIEYLCAPLEDEDDSSNT